MVKWAKWLSVHLLSGCGFDSRCSHLNRLVDHLEKCDFIPNFQYGFRSSCLTAYCLIAVSERFARVFNRSGATRDLAFDISQPFHRF